MNLANLLLEWYDRHRRTFPWRERQFQNADEHAYHTWICEVMSQQTLLSVLLPKYEQFLTELPNVQSLHLCTEEKLRSLWKGLGYYARARNLQKGAAHIVNNLNGIFPKSQKEWENIPGCGPYTSSIIASICYKEKIAAVDGNIIRVISRLCNIQDASIWTPSGYQKIFSLVQNHINSERPGCFNQALMDLGATVCKKHAANCKSCPFKNKCLAYQNNTVQICPPIKPKHTSTNENIYAVLIQNPNNNNQIGILERTHGFLKKTIGFPLLAQKQNFSLETINACVQNYDAKIKLFPNTFKHSITHHKIKGHVIVIESNQENFSVGKFLQACHFETEMKWIDKQNLKNNLSSSLDQKVYKIFLAQE